VANKVMGNPAAVANSVGAASGFISSAIVPGPYEPSRAGAAAYGAGVVKDIMQKAI